VSLFLSSKRWSITIWGSRDLVGGDYTAQSRINLPHYLLTIAAFQPPCQEMAGKFYAA
jgi:hypothetical protein